MQHPLTEVQTMIAELKDGTTTVIDLHRLSQLVEVAQQEQIILKNKSVFWDKLILAIPTAPVTLEQIGLITANQIGIKDAQPFTSKKYQK